MTVGFNRFVRAEWMDSALALASDDVKLDSVRALLQDDLRRELAGEHSRTETVRVLRQIWHAPGSRLTALRDAAVELARAGNDDPVVLHWGMTMAVYPFFGAVGEAVGRQIRLQESVAAPTVLRRVAESYGDRETVSRAAQRVLQSTVEWGVLQRRASGEYVAAPKRKVTLEASAWLVAAALNARRVEAALLEDLHAEPKLFPFDLGPVVQLPDLDLYNIVRQGGGLDVAVLNARQSA